MLRDLMSEGAAGFGLTLSPAMLDSFEAYYRRLTEVNQVMNLTAIKGEAETASLHFLDSLALLSMADMKNASVIDIGTGAGFPGVPLAIAEPTASVTLLDSLRKRIDFLSQLTAELGLQTTCLHARAEELAAFGQPMRGAFDFAVSRAVARLNVLSELCLPYVRQGGSFIAMKSVSADEELLEAEKAIRLLGAEVETVRDYAVPGTDVTHRAILIRKTGETPKAYPRKFAKIQKSPLL